MLRSIVAAALGLCLFAVSASAQPMGQNQPPNQWVSNCNYEKGKDCTVSAMIDGGPNNLLGTFLIVSYSVAYTTLTVVADGIGQRASMQVDNWPFVSTSICTGGACSYEQGKSAELLQTMLKGSSITVQLSTQADGMVGPLTNTLGGFAAAYQRAVEAQRRR
jgi:invasion protein IalB